MHSAMPLDKFDLAILSILQRDARASLQDISSQVGLSTTPCWTRIKKMESEGVIQGYTVRIDPAAVGFSESVVVQLTLESHNDETLDAFGKMLADIPEVLEAYLVSGDYDYYIRIAVRDTRDYERLLRERLYRIPGIRQSKSSFVLRTLKESLLPLDHPVGTKERDAGAKRDMSSARSRLGVKDRARRRSRA
jgi:Lrp/AsnC family leucine-responsive transcriptional regulator